MKTMKLDTSPFHTLQSFQQNDSLRLAFQYRFRLPTNKQSWIFDSGGNETHIKFQNESLIMNYGTSLSTTISSLFSNWNSDNRGFEGRERRVNLTNRVINSSENQINRVCKFLDLFKYTSNICRVRLNCVGHNADTENVECLNPHIVICDQSFHGRSDDANSMSSDRLCLICSNVTTFNVQATPKFNVNYFTIGTNTVCSEGDCTVYTLCQTFHNLTKHSFVTEKYQEKNNYTINHLISPYYTKLSSYIFGKELASDTLSDSFCNTTSSLQHTPTPYEISTTEDISQLTVSFRAAMENINANWSSTVGNLSDLNSTTLSSNIVTDLWTSRQDWLPTRVPGTHVKAMPEYDLSFLFLTAFILVGVGGNILVCLSICLEKRLQNVTNYFLMSLAVADLLVSLVVMPFGAIAGFLGYWPFGLVWCNIYVSCDVLACTSSIMHMCTISLGRYMGIRNPLKTRNNSKKMVGVKVVLVWCSAMLVTSLITVLGIIDPHNIMPTLFLCTINNRAFFFVGSVCAFFVPMVIMVISYALTVHLLRKKAKFASDATAGKARTIGRYRSVRRKATPVEHRPRPYPYDDRMDMTSHYNNENELYPAGNSINDGRDVQTAESIERDTRNFKLKALRLQLVGTAAWHLRFLATKKRNALEANAVATEQKASKVLGLVFFAFLICWTPFFVLNVYMAACPGCIVHDQIANMVLWLGYVSSTINPVIYTVFNNTFRTAFINLLRCRYTFNQRSIRSFSTSHDVGNFGGGGALSHAQVPTTGSVHTLATYARSSSFPSPVGPAAAAAAAPVGDTSAKMSTTQEHKL